MSHHFQENRCHFGPCKWHNLGSVWYMCLNICFQFLNNITHIFTYFFIYKYFQKIQTTFRPLFLQTHLVISFYAVSFEFEHHHNYKILFLFFQRVSSKSSMDDLYINNFPSFKNSDLSLSLTRTQKFEIWNLSAKDGGDGRNRSRTSGPFSTFLSSHLLRFFAFCLVAEKNEGNKEIEEKRNSSPFAFRWFWFRKLKNPRLNWDK